MYHSFKKIVNRNYNDQFIKEMNKIVNKEQYSEKVFKIVVEAPLIAQSRKAGHFVIIRIGEKGERIPLTIAEADTKAGTITLVVQKVGLSSSKLCDLKVGEYITDIVGPLGQPTHIAKFGTVVCAGGGVGVAPMLPIVQALKAAGNKVITVLAGRNKDLIIMEKEMRASSDEVIIMTDDGSYGNKGLVTEGIESVIKREKVDKCFAIGPAIMMKFVCLLTKKYEIPTDVSLNTIMVDGTGMCGACRVTIDGQTKFVCVDGPEFDGHKVDFDEMMKRMGAYKPEERAELEKYEAANQQQAEADEKSRDAAWRVELRASMKPKERMAIPRVKMNELDPAYRAHSRKEEVNQGLTKEQALVEAKCESHCIHLRTKGEAVAIGYLERFAADCERESGQLATPEIAEKNGIKIAVVGSGPSGLSFAGDMAKLGYDVTVFEALHEIGGVLKYGITEFRLPNKIVDVEIENLGKMGVKFVKDCIIGKTISTKQLEEEGFKGIYVASGAGLPNFMHIPGENLINVLSSNEFLTRVNLMDAASEDTDTPVPFGKNVVVVGGGNTAMDSVRTALRLGADSATIVYRRSENEMPARKEEVKHAKEEGVQFLTLHNPLEYISDEQGKVKQVVLQKMQLGEPDASGRRSPEPIPGATETLDADLVIVAVGVSPNPIVPRSVEGLELGRKGTIVVNDDMQSSIPTLFAGGDIVRGGATVILAMGDGRRAAAAMHKSFQK